MTTPIPGQPFGRYLVESAIAVGGMGSVFRATDTVLGRTVALKVTRHESVEARQRFVREARLAARLSHPNIVATYDVGEIEGTSYLTMEWLPGTPLTRAPSLVAHPAARLQALVDVAEALAFAHGHGVVHRDVKPENVIVDDRGRAKLVDFGIARTTEPLGGPSFRTATGLILGTPSYMAPEQMASSNVGAAADQFAWGVIAYELLNGRHPRDGALSFPFHHEPLAWKVAAPPAVTATVMRALALDPAARFPDMRALLEAFGPTQGPAAAGAPGVVLTGAATDDLVAHRPPRPPGPPHGRAVRPRSRRIVPFIVGVAGTLLVASGLALAVAFRRAEVVASIVDASPAAPTTTAARVPVAPVEAAPSVASVSPAPAPPPVATATSRCECETSRGTLLCPPTTMPSCTCHPEGNLGARICPKVPTDDGQCPVSGPGGRHPYSAPGRKNGDACTGFTRTGGVIQPATGVTECSFCYGHVTFAGVDGAACSGVDTNGAAMTGRAVCGR